MKRKGTITMRIFKTISRVMLTVLIILTVLALLIYGLSVFPPTEDWIRGIHLDIREYLNRNTGIYMMANYSAPLWEISLDFEHVAVLRFVEKIPHFSKEKRAEYVFEVVEWVKGGNGETRVSIFSRYCSYAFSNSWLENAEKNDKMQVGEEFLMPFSSAEYGYVMNGVEELEAYTRVEDEMSHYDYSIFWNDFVKVAYSEHNKTLTREEFLACVKNAFQDPDAFKAAIEEWHKGEE